MSSFTHVRLAAAGDLPGVLLLERATPQAPHWPEAVYREYISGSASALRSKALFVAMTGPDVQGFAAAAAVGDEADLESIAVAQETRRSGLGSRLLDAVELWAKQQGAASLLLEVRSANRTAEAFYLSRAFRRDGLRRGYYKDPSDDAILLRKDLQSTQSPASSETRRAVSEGTEL